MLRWSLFISGFFFVLQTSLGSAQAPPADAVVELEPLESPGPRLAQPMQPAPVGAAIGGAVITSLVWGGATTLALAFGIGTGVGGGSETTFRLLTGIGGALGVAMPFAISYGTQFAMRLAGGTASYGHILAGVVSGMALGGAVMGLGAGVDSEALFIAGMGLTATLPIVGAVLGGVLSHNSRRPRLLEARRLLPSLSATRESATFSLPGSF